MMQMKNKKWLFKIIVAIMTIVILLPSIAEIKDVYAVGEETIQDWSQYWTRNKDNEVPMPISGATPRGLQFNRPVYPNDVTKSDGYQAGTGFTTYVQTLISKNTVSNIENSRSGANAIPAVKPNTDLISKYPYPLMHVNYVQDGQNGNTQFSVTNPTLANNGATSLAFNSKDVILPLDTQAKRDTFKNTIDNYNIDWNKNGYLYLTLDYSMLFSNAEAPGFKNNVDNNGLAFNIYFRLPDAYTSQRFNEAIVPGVYHSSISNVVDIGELSEGSGSYFKFQVADSSFSPFLMSKTNRGFSVTGEAVNGLHSFQPVDDHFLKFSISPANQKDGMKPFDNLLNTNGYGQLFNQFSKLLASDVPTELGVKLDMNKLTADGDNFDRADKALTKGRRFPAVLPKVSQGTASNIPMSPFNATYFMATQVQGTQLNGKYAYFPISTNLTPLYYSPTNAIKASTDNHVSLITGVSGTQSTVHKAAITNTSDPANWSTDQFNGLNMDYKNGNSLSTWNQYISLYDSEGKHNTNDLDDEMVNMANTSTDAKQLTSKNLQGPNPLDRSITLNANEHLNDFDPMRYYRSVNYFTKQQTTAATKPNIGWAVVDDNNKPSKDLAVANLVAGGKAKIIYYYGTDENGNIMSPAKLTINRISYDLPKISGKTTLSLTGDSAQQNKTELTGVTAGSEITQTESFDADQVPTGYTVNDGTVHVNLPTEDCKLISVQIPAVGAGKGHSLTPSNITSSGFDVILPTGYFFSEAEKNLKIETKYSIIEDSIGHLDVGGSQLRGTFTNAGGPTPTKNESVSGSTNLAKIEKALLQVTLKQVPKGINFGNNLNPKLQNTYRDVEPDPATGVISDTSKAKNNLIVNSNGDYKSNWDVSAKITGGEKASVTDGVTGTANAADLPGTLYFITGFGTSSEKPNQLSKDSAINLFGSSDQGFLAKGDNILGKQTNNWSFYVNPKVLVNGVLPDLANQHFTAKVTWTLGLGPKI